MFGSQLYNSGKARKKKKKEDRIINQKSISIVALVFFFFTGIPNVIMLSITVETNLWEDNNQIEVFPVIHLSNINCTNTFAIPKRTLDNLTF